MQVRRKSVLYEGKVLYVDSAVCLKTRCFISMYKNLGYEPTMATVILILAIKTFFVTILFWILAF
mgnify:CR=1 FL=1